MKARRKVSLLVDPGNEEFLDLYGFGPLNPNVELEGADGAVELSEFKLFVEYVDKRFEDGNRSPLPRGR